MAVVDAGPPTQEWLAEFSAAEAARRRRRRLIIWLERIVVVVVVLAVWQALEGFGLVKAILISSPWLVAHSLVSYVIHATFYTDLKTTLLEMAVGLAAGIIIGVLFGVLIGMQPRAVRAVEPLVVAINTVPHVVLVPLMVVWFGFGFLPKFIIVAMGVTYVVFINAVAGVSRVDKVLLQNLRILRVGRARMIREVYLPSLASWIIAGLRVAVAFALIGAIVAEFIDAKQGLGFEMTYATQFFNIPMVYAVLVILAVLGIMLSGLVTLAERWLLRWR